MKGNYLNLCMLDILNNIQWKMFYSHNHLKDICQKSIYVQVTACARTHGLLKLDLTDCTNQIIDSNDVYPTALPRKNSSNTNHKYGQDGFLSQLHISETAIMQMLQSMFIILSKHWKSCI